MKFNSSTVIGAEEAALIRHYFDGEEEYLVDDYLVTEIDFPNGYNMELCCFTDSEYDTDETTNPTWGEAMLFDKWGFLVCLEMIKSSAEYFSPTTLSDWQGNEYTAYIIIAKDE